MVEFPTEKGFPDISVQRSEVLGKLKSECMKVGQTWFLIDAKWLKTFKNFVGIENIERSESAINPGPIDNSLLIDETSSDLKPGLIENLDYVAVPESVWGLLYSWYGLKENQTPIERQVINVVRPPNTETKLEVYKIRLNLYPNTKFINCSVAYFSQADTIAKIEEVSRALFTIEEDAKVQVKCFYAPNQSQVLNRENTIYEESLNSDLKIVIEASIERSEMQKSPVEHRRVRRHNSKSVMMLRSGKVTLEGVNSATASAEGRGPPCTPGLSGLMNLGNTCFLNSIIQCLSNCGPITQYFLDGNYKNDINATNPLGRAGQIASSFADVLSMMWSGKHSITAPHNFKLQLTKFAPQFAGCDQHDAQELLTFLLDGLHEDLNRIKDKPYCQTEENDQEDDQALARQSWEYFLRRNDSIIIDNFHGMLKSRVVCPDCEKVSIKFDTFSTLSLPLPLRCDRVISVRFVPYDQVPSLKVKDLLIAVPKKGIIADMATELNKITDVRPEHMVIAEVNRSHFHKFFSMDDPIESIDDYDKIFMYSLPEEMVEDPICKYTILPVVLWEVQELPSGHFLSSLFGTPFLMMLPRGAMHYKTLYHMICERLTRSAEDLLNGKEMNNLFTPVLVNTYCYDNVKKIQDDEDELFEVPESFGRELLALQIPTQVKQEYYRDPPIIQEDHSNGFRPTPKPTLDDCLTLFTTNEKLGESNAWHCPQCNMKKRATKKLDLWKLPNILILHLKRFAFKETRREKIDTKVHFPLTGLNIDTKVDFPLTGLNINHYVVNRHKGNQMYDLIGVCNHYGNLLGGHYTAYCKSYKDGNWYCFDDNSVTPISPESVQSESAYVLFYQRRSQAREDPDQEKADM